MAIGGVVSRRDIYLGGYGTSLTLSRTSSPDARGGDEEMVRGDMNSGGDFPRESHSRPRSDLTPCVLEMIEVSNLKPIGKRWSSLEEIYSLGGSGRRCGTSLTILIAFN